MDKESFQVAWCFYDAGASPQPSTKIRNDWFNASEGKDTANNYQDETSEQFISEWAEKCGIRDQLVIATKFSLQTTAWGRYQDQLHWQQPQETQNDLYWHSLRALCVTITPPHYAVVLMSFTGVFMPRQRKNLVADRKVLCLVNGFIHAIMTCLYSPLCCQSISVRAYLNLKPGNDCWISLNVIGLSGTGRIKDRSMGQRPREDALLHLSRPMGYSWTQLWARPYPHGQVRRSCSCALGSCRSRSS